MARTVKKLGKLQVYKLMTLLSTHRDRYATLSAGTVLVEAEKELDIPIGEYNLRQCAAELEITFKRANAHERPGGSWYVRQEQADVKVAALEQRVKDMGSTLADAVSRLKKLEQELGVPTLRSAL